MIKELVEVWEQKKPQIREALSRKHADNYLDLLKTVLRILEGYNDYTFDLERITEIDNGDYQGTIVYVIGAEGYQPSDHWYVMIGYGSCSVCDTLQAIHNYSDEVPNEEEIDDYMTLSLHIIQGLRKMKDD